MRTAKLISAGTAALLIYGSAVFAQQTPVTPQQNAKAPAWMITEVNHLNGTVALRQVQNGTVGANSPAASERFKVQGMSLDDFHAGDIVTYSATDTGGGTKTITKLQKEK
jgi:hypothetical protein